MAMDARGARGQNFAGAVTRIRTPAPTASIKHHHPASARRLAGGTAQTENHGRPPPRYIDHDGPQIVGLPDTPVRGAAMTSLDAGADESPRARAQVEVEEVTPESAPTGPLTGDPTGLGLACFIMGAVALGLSLVGVVPARALGAPLAIILGATTVGLIITTIWAAALGQSAVATVFGIFAAFWLSYFLLVTGLIRAWFGILPRDATSTLELFLITWLVVVVMLTLATLRLLVSFTVLFVLLGTYQASTGLTKTAGYILLAAAAVGVYLFFNSLSLATGGKALPLGSPLLK